MAHGAKWTERRVRCDGYAGAQVLRGDCAERALAALGPLAGRVQVNYGRIASEKDFFSAAL